MEDELNRLYIWLMASIETLQAQGHPITFGQKAAGVTFNPSKDPNVDEVKALYAQIIDKLNELRSATSSGEAKRYYSKAISYTEDAQMNAVKAITWQYE